MTDLRAISLLASLAWSTACDSQVCREGDTSEFAQFASGERTGSSRLTDAGEELSLNFRATLSELPELWDSHTLGYGEVQLTLELNYEAAPFGGDGKTEMPTFEVEFVPEPRSDYWMRTTLPAHHNPFLRRRKLFEPCIVDDDEYCCRFGERECSLPVGVRVRRIQGDPYPPVVANWVLAAAASVRSCPEPIRAQFSFEPEEP